MLANVLGYSLLDPTGTRSRAVPRPAAQAVRRRGGSHVVLRGVRKSFGARTAIDGVHLDIAPGSFVAIVGRSGEGKSTLLRLLAGLESPDSGDVLHDNATVAAIAPDVTMMFQDARLLPWQCVLGNVGIARGADWKQRAVQALAAVGLAERAHDWPAALSGGQKQRVALARALVAQPGLLLLDEPLGALDALTRAEMQHLIERVWRDTGFTAVLVTHDVAEAVALADRVLVLRRGRIARDVPIGLPRPRLGAEAAALQAAILDTLLPA